MAGIKETKRSDKKRRSDPYSTDRGLTLKDRIGSVSQLRSSVSAERSSTRVLSNENQSRTRNHDNPLYAYLGGGKHSQKPSNKRIESPRTGTAYACDSEALALTKHDREMRESARNPRNSSQADGFSIRGLGASANAFSIRGASSTSVSIKNLAPGTSQADVCTILNEQIGEVEQCVTFPVKGGISTTAEVKFGSRIAADKAIDILHGVLADNKRLDVSILLLPESSRDDSQPSNRSFSSRVIRDSERQAPRDSAITTGHDSRSGNTNGQMEVDFSPVDNDFKPSSQRQRSADSRPDLFASRSDAHHFGQKNYESREGTRQHRDTRPPQSRRY